MPSSSIRREATRALLITAFVQAIATGCEPTAPLAPADEKNLVPEASHTTSVSSLTASTVSWSEIDLSWPTSPSASGYQVFRSTTGAAGAYSTIATTGANVGNYADRGLTASTNYCYEIRSFKDTGKGTTYSAYSGPACATTSPPPVVAPSETNAVPQGTQILITWKDNSDNEDGFRIERAPSAVGPWAQAATVSANATSANVPATPEEQVCFRVIAFNAVGPSLPSSADCTALPATPTYLSATALDPQSITLSWTDNSVVEDGYRVYRGSNFGGLTEIATLPANAVTYRDVGVSPDVYYTYEVRALKDGGYTDGVQATALIPTSIPAAPTDVNISFGYNTQYVVGLVYLYVYWSDASMNEAGFRIEYSFDGVNDWSKYAETPANYDSFQDSYWTDAPPSELCIRVIAFNALGDSPPSNVACGTIDLSQIYAGAMAVPNNGLTHRVTRAGSPAAGLKNSRVGVPDRAASTKPSRIKTVPRHMPPAPNVPPSR